MAFEGEDAKPWSIVTAPTLQPAVDFITKTPNGPFIDTGLNVTFEMRGRVYLAVATIKEMAEIAGLLDSKTAQEKSVHDTQTYNQGYEAGLKEGTDLIGKLNSVISRIDRSVGDTADSVTVVDEAEPNPAGNKPRKSDSDTKHV